MTADTVQALASVAGLLLAVVGLPVLFLQLRDVQRSVRSSVHAAMYTQGADFRAHLVEHPELRPYFFDGVEIEPDHGDYLRALTIAELFLNHLEHVAVMMESFGEVNRPALERFIRKSLADSPLLRGRLDAHREAYSDALLAFAPDRPRLPGRSDVD